MHIDMRTFNFVCEGQESAANLPDSGNETSVVLGHFINKHIELNVIFDISKVSVESPERRAQIRCHITHRTS